MWKHPWSWVASRGADCSCKGLVNDSNPFPSLMFVFGPLRITPDGAHVSQYRRWTHLWRFETGLLSAEVKIIKNLSVGHSIKKKPKFCLGEWAVSGCPDWPEFSSSIFDTIFNLKAHWIRKLGDALICYWHDFRGESWDRRLTSGLLVVPSASYLMTRCHRFSLQTVFLTKGNRNKVVLMARPAVELANVHHVVFIFQHGSLKNYEVHVLVIFSNEFCGFSVMQRQRRIQWLLHGTKSAISDVAFWWRHKWGRTIEGINPDLKTRKNIKICTTPFQLAAWQN